MQTSDWAQEAADWFESYHQAILSNKDVTSLFFNDLIVDDDIYESFRKHPLLGEIDLKNWKSTPFELLEQARGWKPFLARLPKVADYRLLTLVRRDLTLSIDDTTNQTLVSRQHWTLLEGLRWKAGLYKDPDVLEKIKAGHNSKQQCSSEKEIPSFDAQTNLEIKLSETAGRQVYWKGSKRAKPGDILLEATPFVVAPYDFEGSAAACFHCGSATKSNVVRNLGLQCKLCQIWSFCSMECKQRNSKLHALECKNVAKLCDICESIGMPQFKGLLVLRAALQAENFLEDAEIEQQWKQTLDLECHEQDHREKNPKYVEQAEGLANYMIQEKFVQRTNVTTLSRLFYAININAIGLGANGAAGLFPGLPSMFNHSCNENLTHGWDSDGVLRFRAVEEIPTGAECCISYVTNLEAPTAERTAPLTHFKFFACQCSRCQSLDEEGRSDAIAEWKSCLTQLQEKHSADSMQVYRRLVELSDVLFPTYFVTKGWAMEECAHALLQDTRLKSESLELLQKARIQYTTCRGEDSVLVQRVDEAIASLMDGKNEEEKMSCPADDENSVGDDDLVLARGWNHTLFEVKTYDSEDDLIQLAGRIKSTFNDTNFVKWIEGHRLCEIGFGIKTLIVACEINQSLKDRDIFAEDIVDQFDDNVQNVDIIDVQEYN